MSYRTLSTKPLNASLKTLLKRSGHIGVGLGAFAPVLALANPTGGQVAAGQASIAAHGANGMVITQNSQSAIINWQQFNIGAGQYVQFLQPSSSSVVLNRVIGGSPSSILGSLTANGQVFLVNTNGVYFGKGASIDTQGFLASSLGISNQNFLAHNYVFDQAGSAGATVVNDGSITAHHSGYVVLAGDYAENDGIIAAQSGHVILASGAKATLSLNGNSLINFAVNQSTLATYAGVKNAGSILADGGTVIMTADVANLLKSTVVNNTGLIEAHALSNNGGVIQLLATGGNIQNAGTLDASGTRAGQAGGQITLKGDERTTLTDTSNIDALGQGANGGAVEVSGNTLAMRGAMNIGKGGKLLLDPTNIEIEAGTHGSSNAHSTASGENGSVGLAFIETQLNHNVAVTISAHTLIDASAGVNAITATGKGNLSFKTATGGQIDLVGVDITIGGKLTANMGHGTFGYLTAGSMSLHASNGLIDLANAVGSAHGDSKFSAKTTTGALTITATNITADHGSGASGIGLDAKTTLTMTGGVGGSGGSFGNNVILQGATVHQSGLIMATGKFTAAASAGDETIQFVEAKAGATVTDTGGNLLIGQLEAANGVATITDKKGTLTLASHGIFSTFSGGQGLTINAAHIVHSGSGGALLIAGGGKTLTVNGVFGANSAAGFDGQLMLEASQTSQIDVNSNIKARTLLVDGGQLVYTGKNTSFSLAATDGNVTMFAAIGSAAAPVKYNVAISDKDGEVELQRSIYVGSTAGKAAANISVSQTGLDGSHLAGVLVGSDISLGVHPMTLSAKGNITLTGVNVGIGHVISSSHGKYDQISILAGKNVTITAQGTGSHSGQVGIAAQGGSGALDRSILVQSGGNLTLIGHDVDVRAGDAKAFNGNSANGIVSYDADVTLKAGGNVTLQSYGGNGRVDLIGGSASAHADGASSFTRIAVADAGITIIAGKAISLTAHQVKASAGYAVAEAVANDSASNSASADTGITLTAGTNIALTATGGSIDVHGAGAAHNPGASNGYADVQFATVTAAAHGDVEFSAGGGIALNATQVTVQAGNRVGVIHAASGGNVHGFDGRGVATFIATGNVDFTAGTGGIAINAYGGSADIKGGNETGYGAKIVADFHGSANMDAEAHVDFTTTGNIQITGTHVEIVAGNHGASGAQVIGSYGGVAALTVDQDVDLNAKGALTITAVDDAHLDASGGQADLANIDAAHSGHAKITASGGINVNAGSVTISGSTLAEIDAGYGAGKQASVIAGSGGQAVLDAMSSISVTAVTGNIALKSKQNVFVTAGGSLGAGYGVTAPGATSIVFQNSGGTQFRSKHSHHTDYTQVLASGSGAQASLTLGGAVNLSAKGGITLTQTAPASGSIKVTGGSNALDDMNAHAAGGGSANVSAKSGVSLQAGGKLSLAGRHVSIKAGDIALHGASRSVTSSYSFVCPVSTACGGHFNQHFGSVDAKGDSASGHGSKVNVVANTSVAIKAGSVSISSLGSRMSLSGGEDGVHQAVITANGGAVTSVNLSDQVTITATGAVTLSALHEIVLEGGARSGGFSLTAQGGSANLVTTTGVDISAATLKLAAGSVVTMLAGSNIGNRASIQASHGTAKATETAGIHLTAKSVMGISLLGSESGGAIDIRGGGSAGQSAQVAAGSGGIATLDVSDDATLTVTAAGGTLTVSGGKIADAQINIKAGHDIGQETGGSRGVHAEHGSAGMDLTGNVSLSALGTVTLAAGKGNHSYAGGDLTIEGASESLASAARAHASNGGKATFSAAGNTTISGGNVSLAGLTIEIRGGGSGNGNDVHVTASGGGFASVAATALTTIKATGTLTATAVDDMSILGVFGNNGRDVSVSAAGGKATANYTLDESTKLSAAGGISLKAGSSIDIAGQDSSAEGSGSGGKIKAEAQGKATYDQTASVTITTGGTFTAVAAHALSMQGARSMGGFGNSVSAYGGGATAAYVADGTLKLSAKTIKLSASSMSLHGGLDAARGSSGVGMGGHAHAKLGGSAALSVDQSLDLTAITAFSAKLTGAGSQNRLQIYGGGKAGVDASASASGALSKATLTTTATANVLVTGAGGTITLSTGKTTDALVYVGGSSNTGSGMHAKAVKHGTAAATATGGATLNAKGAVSLSEANGTMSIVGAFSDNGFGMNASASTGGKATAIANTDVSITGASVTLTTGGILKVMSAREDVGNDLGANAKTGATANVALNAQATLTALTGALSLTGGSMKVLAAGGTVGSLAEANASHAGARAIVALDAHTLLSGATGVSLVTTATDMVLAAASDGAPGTHATIVALNGGHTSLTEDVGLSIVTGGAFKASAARNLNVFGASHLGRRAHVRGSSSGVATVSFEGALNITAKSILLAAAKTLEIHGGDSAAFSAQVTGSHGSAAVSADASVNLVATGGSITVRGVGLTSIAGGRLVAAGAGATSHSSVSPHNFGTTSTGAFSRSNSSHRAVHTATVSATGGTAILTGNAEVNLTATGAISVSQTSDGNTLKIQGGASATKKTDVFASNHGTATVDGEADVSFKTGGALTLKGHHVQIFGGNSAAFGAASSFQRTSVSHCTAGAVCGAPSVNGFHTAPVQAQGIGASAKLTGGADVNVQAASVAINAASDLSMAGGAFTAESAQATAAGSGDKATVLGHAALDIKTTGNIVVTAGHVSITGGFEGAESAQVRTDHGFASASLDADSGLSFDAGGALTISAKSMSLGGSDEGGASAQVVAFGSGAVAKLKVEGGVTLAAASLSLTVTGLPSTGTHSGSGNLRIRGGDNAENEVTGLNGGSAATLIDNGVSLTATGTVTLTALHGDLFVSGGRGSISQGVGVANASGGSVGTAKASLVIHSGVAIAAGTNLTFKANGSIDLFAGQSNMLGLQASSGGSANAELDASVKLSAKGTVSLTATRGDIGIGGGAFDGILVDVDTGIVRGSTSTASIGVGKAGGFANGLLDASATITAGQDADLKAGGRVFVAAGAGETLAVGAFRKVFLQSTHGVVTGSSSQFIGSAWGGGSAHLTANLDAAIVAGRDINVSAGTAHSGNIVVQGLEGNPERSDGFVNLASVRGGSSNAVADLNLTADASLTAGRDIVLSAKGNASVDGGSLNVVDADHTQGSVTITASAGAALHAGRNVVLNAITGSLTVAGINVNASHAGRVSASAHPAANSSEARATVTAHADATITAVGNISTVSSLGGALNVVGGQFVGARVSGGDSGMATATATANASIVVGGNVAIKTKGDLNLLGGDFDGAAAAASGTLGGATQTAATQAKAGITAGGQVTLTIGGNATLAGGDSMGVRASGSLVGGEHLTATADVSAAIQGAGISLSVAKNLLVRAGSSDHAQAQTNGGGDSVTATATADVSLITTGNLAITVGKGKVGSASFVAGNDDGVVGFAIGSSKTVTANMDADMDISVGGNLTLSVGGPLHISGGQGAGLGAFLDAGSVSSAKPAPGSVVTGNVSAKSVISVGGNLTVTLHGGDASLLGGGQAASDAFLAALGNSSDAARTSLNVDSSLSIKAGGALKITGAGLLTVATQLLATSTGGSPVGLPSVFVASGGAVSGKIKSSVSIHGKSVNLNNAKNVSTLSNGSTSLNGLLFEGSISIVNTGGGQPIGAAPSPLSVHAAATLGAHALLSTGVRSLSEWRAVPVSDVAPSQVQSLDTGAVQLAAPAVQLLDTLETQGLTVNLVTVIGDGVPVASTEAATLFTPGDIVHTASFLGSCNTLSLQPSQPHRCTVGGK